MNILINFATTNFQKAQQFNTKTAYKIGGFDRTVSANPSLIDENFRRKYISVLNQAKGAGYWLWKPYFIVKTLEAANDGDIVMYADSASYFTSSASPLFSLPERFGQDIIPFELELPESAWSKRDAFILLGAENGFELSSQRLASFMLFRKSASSIQFCQEYLYHCTNENALTDLDNIYGKPNYPDFVAHRHDQSIFSLLSKKYGLQAFRDPSQWGNSRKDLYLNSNYPQIIEHTRQKNPKQAKFTYKIKRFLFPKK